jgi:hypothetical protein
MYVSRKCVACDTGRLCRSRAVSKVSVGNRHRMEEPAIKRYSHPHAPLPQVPPRTMHMPTAHMRTSRVAPALGRCTPVLLQRPLIRKASAAHRALSGEVWWQELAQVLTGTLPDRNRLAADWALFARLTWGFINAHIEAGIQGVAQSVGRERCA